MKRVIVGKRAINCECEGDGIVRKYLPGYEGPLDSDWAIHYARRQDVSILGDESEFEDEPIRGTVIEPSGVSQEFEDARDAHMPEPEDEESSDDDTTSTDEDATGQDDSGEGAAGDPAGSDGAESGADAGAGEGAEGEGGDGEGDGDTSTTSDPAPKPRTRKRATRK